MKAYYSKVADKASSPKTSSTGTTSAAASSSSAAASSASTAVKADTTTADTSKSLAKTMSDLSSASYTSDNMDSLYSKVSDFVKNYNSAVSAGTSSSITSVKNNTSWMEGTTSSNKNLLSKAGITVNSNNTISLDEKAFKKSDLTTLKDIFGGGDNYSYGSQISGRAQKMYSLAATGGTSDSTYTGNASYSAAATGTMYSTTT